jgi:hypothetical protein
VTVIIVLVFLFFVWNYFSQVYWEHQVINKVSDKYNEEMNRINANSEAYARFNELRQAGLATIDLRNCPEENIIHDGTFVYCDLRKKENSNDCPAIYKCKTQINSGGIVKCADIEYQEYVERCLN